MEEIKVRDQGGGEADVRSGSGGWFGSWSVQWWESGAGVCFFGVVGVALTWVAEGWGIFSPQNESWEALGARWGEVVFERWSSQGLGGALVAFLGCSGVAAMVLACREVGRGVVLILSSVLLTVGAGFVALSWGVLWSPWPLVLGVLGAGCGALVLEEWQAHEQARQREEKRRGVSSGGD